MKGEVRSGCSVTDKISAIFEKDRHIISYDIAKELDVDHKTVHIKTDLTERNLLQRVSICDSLLKRNNSYPFLKQLITGDEKWDKNVKKDHCRSTNKPHRA